MKKMQEWVKFKGKKWQQTIDVEDFIINNYKEYDGSSEFLKGISRRTNKIWNRCQKLIEKESVIKILDVEDSYFSSIDGFEVGYIDKKSEVIVGLQTDEPLKLFINPYISLDSSLQVIKNNGYRFDKESINKFKEFSCSVEDIVKDTYTDEIKLFKKVHLVEGLPDSYGRGFIVSDYRRVALYGTDYLIAKKKHDLERLKKDINYSVIRTREEVVKQIKALEDMKIMASHYGYNISRPAKNAKEAIQWLYFAYLSAVKQNNGVSIPTGNNSAFIDIYIERDLENGILTEEAAQELIDQFVIKLRMVRFIRTPEFNNYFLGKNPIITETIGGSYNNKSLITKTSFRLLNTMENLDVDSIPNFAIMWSKYLPENFKIYCSKVMLKYNELEFINDDNCDMAITGVSGKSKIGKQIDYYGGNCNLAKALLYAINGGMDEITGETVIEGIEPLDSDILDYSKIARNLTMVLRKIINVQSDAANIIHFIQDKYSYESIQMALNDTVVERYITFGITGLSTLVDSLSAIRYSDVVVKRNENGISTDFSTNDKFPRFGNNIDEVDKIAFDIVRLYYKLVSEKSFYRNAKVKIGIDSNGMNIVYGKNTGATPDGRFSGVVLASGANPTSNVDNNGILSSLKSIIKLPRDICSNGIVTTLNITPGALGTKKSERCENIVALLDNYFESNGVQLEINIIEKNEMLEAFNNGDKYSNFVIRNSGCAVKYCNLTTNQQDCLVDRTYHKVK